MTRSARALLRVLAVSAGLAQASDIHPAPREEWSGTYRCGPRIEDPAHGSGYSAQVTLVLNDGVATITRQSGRVSQTLTGKVGADGRVTLEGGGAMRSGRARWRYYFNGRFEGNKFAARGATLSASGESKLRECTMTLARVSASVPRAASAHKEPTPLAVGPEPAPITATPAQQPAAVEPPVAVELPAAPIAENKIANRLMKYSRGDRILLALFLGLASAGIGVLLYDWRRPMWLTPTKAVAAVVATALGTAGLAYYALSHLDL